ncbi:2-aminoethylphosphonate ABC transport system, ATP-binding protein component (plasmid) [Gloeocapsa sp. PCC 7428]|uniref:putative 2-aminoethylphosphonate ABC transporter ATP-binding protein n=1 Tax=Gloeocapsa sp. PCC 7428 TaxID=1173026 RepID=UPI0002A6111E|nr:putative 2-aminoethylphosphonate ABC transporter ATP-binding protein [Gloeocapsa sp. PCC 7428]AFZ33357.1 2-aminoethylphosphonate ABC transport system, ATP-binding protein component [Gloeocapsa sp. PCC 7428]
MNFPEQPTTRQQRLKQQSTSYEPTLAREIAQPYLQIENIQKSFGNFVALRDIYLDVYPGEFICLLGPSGCGKTTLLRIICGLETQTSGRVIQGGKDVSRLPASKRDFGIVFQSYALFPNLTAAQNIAYGLQNAKKSQREIKTRVEELLDTVGLNGMENKYPAQMSGGQQQRVALARALALSPGLLLLDEPLSALDAQVRVRLRTEIAQLQKRLGITTVMVTHDQAEALAMADRIVVMDKGYIAQVGTPRAIYQQPHTPFVANFIGVMNFLSGVVVSETQVRCGNIILEAPQNVAAPDQSVSIAIRPEDVQVLNTANQHLVANAIAAEVQSIEFLGSGFLVGLRPEGNFKELICANISAQAARQLDLTEGSAFQIQLPPESIRVFTTNSDGQGSASPL